MKPEKLILCGWGPYKDETEIDFEKLDQEVRYNVNEKSLARYLIDLTELKKKNPDTVAWLKVNNTKVNYPVKQTNDNRFYLNQ